MDELKQQIEALQELVKIQKQTIEALKAQPPKVVYHTYLGYQYHPYINSQWPYYYGTTGTGQNIGYTGSTTQITYGTGTISGSGSALGSTGLAQFTSGMLTK